MTRTPQHPGASQPGGYPAGPGGAGLDADDQAGISGDYDGGLQAAAEDGRIAVFHNPGSERTRQTGTTNIDSPFLGLFEHGGASPQRVASHSNGHRQVPTANIQRANGAVAPPNGTLPDGIPLDATPDSAPPQAARLDPSETLESASSKALDPVRLVPPHHELTSRSGPVATPPNPDSPTRTGATRRDATAPTTRRTVRRRQFKSDPDATSTALPAAQQVPPPLGRGPQERKTDHREGGGGQPPIAYLPEPQPSRLPAVTSPARPPTQPPPATPESLNTQRPSAVQAPPAAQPPRGVQAPPPTQAPRGPQTPSAAQPSPPAQGPPATPPPPMTQPSRPSQTSPGTRPPVTRSQPAGYTGPLGNPPSGRPAVPLPPPGSFFPSPVSGVPAAPSAPAPAVREQRPAVPGLVPRETARVVRPNALTAGQNPAERTGTQQSRAGRPATTQTGARPGKRVSRPGSLPDRGRTSRDLDRAPKPKRKDRDAMVELAITEIAGHLTFTPNSVTAWYTLPEVRWAFRPDSDRESLLMAISEQYASLAGFRIHLRRTTRPFPADQWARVVDNNTPHPLPPVDNAPSWADHLVAAQRHLIALNHAEGQTFLGIAFARRTLGDTFAERIGRLFNKGVADAERRRMARTVEQFDEVLGAFGIRGRRVSAEELEFLLYRSIALGMAPPAALSNVDHGIWERGDLLALTEQIERYRTPYGSTVKLVNRLTNEERHVAVLAVGRMEPLEIPERHEPWLHFHERLPWPMEISSRVDLLGPGDSFRNLEHRLRLIRSQQQDYAEHGIDSPPELERLALRALSIGDDMTTGLPVESSRAHGWHRIAVSGRNREECLERARRLTQLYSREMRISLQHPKNQDWLAREFIPGEPLANTGYLRRMPIKLFAAALPQAASTVGDRRGDLIGRTAGTSRRPVFLDLHFPMEVRERSGLAVFVAEPGGGKSTLMGALGYLAARRGVQVTLLDPSGPLARLCHMPEMRPYAHVLNLTGSEQGTLAPYALIPTPQRVHFPPGPEGDRDFDIALSNARAERRMLVQDICMMLVPSQVAREASTATLLRHAVRQVPAEERSTLEDVIRILREMGDPDAAELGNLLLDTAEMPLAMLFFGKPPSGSLGSDAALTVITMAGLRLPDLKIEREYWSAEESLALPMLHTAHRLAVRRCYGGDMYRRKLVGLDEAHFMEGWRSGRSFLVRLARDSRKWNLAALVASQNPRDILGLDVQNLVSTVFVGRIAEDTEIATEALRLLRVPTGVGYEQTLASLSQIDTSSAARLGFREFVMRDVDGRVQKVRVDVSYVPDLLTYLDTTPPSATDPVLVGPRKSKGEAP